MNLIAQSEIIELVHDTGLTVRELLENALEQAAKRVNPGKQYRCISGESVFDVIDEQIQPVFSDPFIVVFQKPAQKPSVPIGRIRVRAGDAPYTVYLTVKGKVE